MTVIIKKVYLSLTTSPQRVFISGELPGWGQGSNLSITDNPACITSCRGLRERYLRELRPEESP